MGEPNADELIRTTLDRRTEELRATLAADLETAWKHGVEAGKAEGFAEGEFRGRKQGVIRVAMNCLRQRHRDRVRDARQMLEEIPMI